MNKIFIGLLGVSLLFTQYGYYGSTTAPVTIAGGIIKAKHVQEVTKKYKRKDCPVCKGQGWYWSGDMIKKIDCSYCEPDTSAITIGPIKSINAAPKAPGECDDNQCRSPAPKTRK